MPPPESAPYTIITFGANGESFGPSVSDDERYVVFTSEASNLTSDPDNDRTDIFLWDRFTSTMKNLTAGADGDSLGGVISGDGTTVAFYSDATNLTADPDNGQFDVFTIDLATSTVVNHTAGGDEFSGFPAVSDDGSVVAFQSYASNLTAGGDDDGGAPDIFTASGAGITQVTDGGDFFQPTVSGDGLTVGFQAYNAFGGTADEPVVVLTGAVSGVQSSPGAYAGELSLSDNAGRVAFRTFTAPNGAIQVNGAIVSNPDEASTDPALTDDGSAVVYSSSSGFIVRTRVGGTTSAVAAGNGPLRTPAVAATTGLVAFTSYATDLLAIGDPNGTIGDIVTVP
jgi:Tol biopolymer transport system component